MSHHAQIEAKYDKSLEVEVRAWIEAKTGEKIGEDFQEGLKSGVLICKYVWFSMCVPSVCICASGMVVTLAPRLMNVIKPGSIKSINAQSTLAFKQVSARAVMCALC